jgi:hypothetical protein
MTPYDPAPRRTNAERVAVRHLEAAMIEQARLGDALERAAGTSAEQPAYVRLRVASKRVEACDREVRDLARSLSEDGRPPDAAP